MSLANILRLVMFVVALQASRRWSPVFVALGVCLVGFLLKTYDVFGVLFNTSMALEVRLSGFQMWMVQGVQKFLLFDVVAAGAGALIGWSVSCRHRKSQAGADASLQK